MKKVIQVKNIKKSFYTGNVNVEVLKNLSFEIYEKEFIAIMGPSGSGKSTILYMISLLDYIDSGEILIFNKNVTHTNNKFRTSFRLNNFGYVFQDYNLIPDLNILDNVALPLIQKGLSISKARKEALEALRQVNLKELFKRYPSELSGGQQQRVSVARAIVNKPKILFADEPTANLDSKNSENIINLFRKLNKEFGLTVVMVTHEDEFIKKVDRVLWIKDGTLDLKKMKIKHSSNKKKLIS